MRQGVKGQVQRSDVERLTKRLQETNEQAFELKAQLIHHINTSTEIQWYFVQSEEHQGLRPYDSKTPRVDHEGIQSFSFNAGRIIRAFASRDEELWD